MVKKFYDLITEKNNTYDEDVFIHLLLGKTHETDEDNIIVTTYLIRHKKITHFDEILKNFHFFLWKDGILKEENLDDLYSLLVVMVEMGADLNWCKKNNYSLLTLFSDLEPSVKKWNFISILLDNGFIITEKTIKDMDDFSNKESTIEYIKSEYPELWEEYLVKTGLDKFNI